MVNGKAVVAVLVVVVLLSVGGIAGAALLGVGSTDDPAGDSTDSATDQDEAPSTAEPTATRTAAPTATANGTAAPSTTEPTATPAATRTATPTATATVAGPATPTPPPSQREPMLPRRFDERVIEREIRRLVNDWREEQGLPAYGVPNGTVTARLDRMADAHSVAMADHGTVAYEVNGTDVVDRYEDHDLLGTCKFKRAGKQYIVTPENYRFEALDRTYAGRAYEDGDGYRYNENETQVAQAVFEEWRESVLATEPLTFENANRLGVGIEITATNEVYATGNICGSGKSTTGG